VIAQDRQAAEQALRAAGFGEDDIDAWRQAWPDAAAEFTAAVRAHEAFWGRSAVLLACLPPKRDRTGAAAQAAAVLKSAGTETRRGFLHQQGLHLYRQLTDDFTRFLRIEALVTAAAQLVPGLVPGAETLAAEANRPLKDKEGHEADQGLFASLCLADERCGRHLCHAMLRPRPEATDLLARLETEGGLDLGPVSVRRQGRASVVTLQNPRFLNAEDEATLDLTETAVDLALLDPATEICVLRGGVVDHPKYAGERVFCAGINLTHLYHGKIPYLWYLRRDLGVVNKVFRGLAMAETDPDEIFGGTREKPWIAVVDRFAIGGGCQYLLVCDYVVAGADAYMTLPARKEGIIPGVANLRLPRFVGDRAARQAIMAGRRFACDSPEGHLICDRVVPPAALDHAMAESIAVLTDAGMVSAAGNRRVMRLGQEPLDLFRRYMAAFAREQAECQFSPALVANLERHWQAAERRV